MIQLKIWAPHGTLQKEEWFTIAKRVCGMSKFLIQCDLPGLESQPVPKMPYTSLENIHEYPMFIS
jgi:hypothetical protein